MVPHEEEQDKMMEDATKATAVGSGTSKSCCCCPKTKKMRCCVGCSVFLVIFATIGVATSFVFRTTLFMYPIHASCNITWTFQENCDGVSNKLIQQMEIWKTNATCGTGQKCLYSFGSAEGNLLKATHTTPKAGYIDDMEFKLYPSTTTGGCNVVGYSTSRIFFAILDFGTNYCNLFNLVEGAGLTGDPKYTETTRDEICTQYTSKNCDKY